MPLFEKAKQAGVLWLLRRLPPCQEIIPLVSQAMDRRLSLREHFQTKLHLYFCDWCARYLQQLHFMREAFHRHAHHEENGAAPPGAPTLSPEARDRLKRTLEGDM